MKCSICGCENEDGVQVCSACGAPLQEMVPCCHCGKPIRSSARFCVYCGTCQTAAPVQEPPAEVPVTPDDVPAPDTEPAAEPAFAPIPEPVIEQEPENEPISYVTAPVPPVNINIAPTAVPTLRPAYQLPTHRGLLKMLLLGLVTFMIYPLVIMSRISGEINMVASRHDGKRTIHFLFVPVLSALTLGIYSFVWIHKLCNRIGQQLQRRNIDYRFGAGNFWLWNCLWGIIGAVLMLILLALLPMHPELAGYAVLIYIIIGLLIVIGPLVFEHQLMKATNLMNQDYNLNG